MAILGLNFTETDREVNPYFDIDYSAQVSSLSWNINKKFVQKAALISLYAIAFFGAAATLILYAPPISLSSLLIFPLMAPSFRNYYLIPLSESQLKADNLRNMVNQTKLVYKLLSHVVVNLNDEMKDDKDPAGEIDNPRLPAAVALYANILNSLQIKFNINDDNQIDIYSSPLRLLTQDQIATLLAAWHFHARSRATLTRSLYEHTRKAEELVYQRELLKQHQPANDPQIISESTLNETQIRREVDLVSRLRSEMVAMKVKEALLHYILLHPTSPYSFSDYGTFTTNSHPDDACFVQLDPLTPGRKKSYSQEQLMNFSINEIWQNCFTTYNDCSKEQIRAAKSNLLAPFALPEGCKSSLPLLYSMV